MFFYNTLTRKKEKFEPIDNEVKIYACGPTVYDFIHIGNARPLCVFDVLRNFLEYIGYKIKFVQNFTDIDDKIINKAKRENTDFMSISKKYINEFNIDSKGLGVREADVHPLATETIPQMLKIIEKLINNKNAYKLENGDVYFKAKSFKNYGILSNQSIDDLESGARIEIDENKEDPLDFALWKSSKEGEPYWDSPWGEGRPGWHIECSAMAFKFLGETIDIHCGGQDLTFPHHENEIAQSECASCKKFCNYWLHNGYINIDNKKMSKSLNNFLTVRSISEKYGYETIRYLMISSHYRSPINYSEESMEHCQSAIKRLYNFKENLIFKINNESSKENIDDFLDVNEYKNNFISAMSDDLNTSKALSVIFKIFKKVNILFKNFKNNKSIPQKNLIKILDFFNESTKILGIIQNKINSNEKDISEKIKLLIELRNDARKNKDYKKSDEIREELKKLGINIEDTNSGVKIIKNFE